MHISDFGFRIGCGELDIVLNSLESALKQAESANLTGTSQYISAKSFYDEETGFFSQTVVATGSACSARVSQAKSYIAALNSIIANAGQIGIVIPDVVPSESSLLPEVSDSLSNLKWIVLAAAGVYVFGPYLREMLGRKARA